MLTIYKKVEEIPKGMLLVRDNDGFFKANSEILSTDLCRQILKEIDGATYVSSKTFIGRNKELGAFFSIFLSSGTKTLLNILNHDGICFDVIECGDNAIDFIPSISLEVNDGHVLLKNCVYPFEDNYDCDICYNGKRYYRIFDFSKDIYKEVM